MSILLCSCNWHYLQFLKEQAHGGIHPGHLLLSCYAFHSSHWWQCNCFGEEIRVEIFPFFRGALSSGIEQQTGWVHRYSQSQGCTYTTDTASRPSSRSEHQLEKTYPEEGELEWPRAEPGNELASPMQVVKVPKLNLQPVPDWQQTPRLHVYSSFTTSKLVPWHEMISSVLSTIPMQSSQATSRHCPWSRTVQGPLLIISLGNNSLFSGLRRFAWTPLSCIWDWLGMMGSAQADENLLCCPSVDPCVFWHPRSHQPSCPQLLPWVAIVWVGSLEPNN